MFRRNRLDNLVKYSARPNVQDAFYSVKYKCKEAFRNDGFRLYHLLTEKKEELEKKIPKLAGILDVANAVASGGVALGEKPLDYNFSEFESFKEKVEDAMASSQTGFDTLKSAPLKEKIQQLLQPIVNIQDDLRKNLLPFEQQGENIFSVEHVETVVQASPSEIIEGIHELDRIMQGRASCGTGKPLFQQIIEVGSELTTADDFNEFMTSLLLNFQATIGLEVRAVRMLRSVVLRAEKDENYRKEVEEIIENLGRQRSELDPALHYLWYVELQAFGGTYLLRSVACRKSVYVKNNITSDVRLREAGHPGDQGLFYIEPIPTSGGKFLISTNRWKDFYIYMQNGPGGDIHAWKGDPELQGHWIITIKDLVKHRVVLSPAKWPNWYMCITSLFSEDVKGTDNITHEALFQLDRCDPLPEISD